MCACPYYSNGAKKVEAFEDISGVVLALETLLSPCFGPDGSTVLVEGCGGTGCIENGLQLITSLNYMKPVSRLLVQAVTSFYKASGDGSIKFILMVAAALKELSLCIGEGSEAVTYGQATAEMSSILTSTIIPSLASSQTCLCWCLDDDMVTRDSLVEMCLQLAETCIGNKWSLNVKKTLLQVISTLICPGDEMLSIQSLNARLGSILTNFDEVVTQVQNVPVMESRAIPGFILERSFLVAPPSLPLQDFGMILLLSGLELDDEDSNKTIYQVDSALHLSHILQDITQQKKELIQSLANQGVRLVCCARKIDPVSAHYLRQHSIGAVQMVAEETLRYMAERCGTQPFLCARDLVDMVGSSFIRAKSSCYLRVGRTRFINIICESSGFPVVGPSIPVPCVSVLLCGMTSDRCVRLTNLLHHLLRMLGAWCPEGKGRRLMALKAGGSWEIAVARELERRFLSNNILRGSVKWQVCKAMKMAFLAIPLTLLKNARSPQTRNSIKTLHILLGNTATMTDTPLGVDIAAGCLKSVESHALASAWEPYPSQLLLIHSVCDLLKAVLRIDSVMKTSHVKSSLLLQTHHNSEEEEGIGSRDNII